MTAESIYHLLASVARTRRRSLQEVLMLYGLERVLARLSLTPYANDFALKGGVLLAAYQLRRPTSDIDIQALGLELDIRHLRDVVAAIAAVDADDGLVLDLTDVKIEAIRDEDEYSGLRVRVPATIHRAKLVIKLDVSTGDPISPAVDDVTLPGLLGDDVTMLGHPMATVIAEKAVTILQRGTTSTRWRDFVDLRALARAYPHDGAELRTAAAAVAAHREVALAPIAPLIAGYGLVGQAKWAVWLRKNEMTDAAEASLDGQMMAIVAFIDPVFTGTLPAGATWVPDKYTWAPKTPDAAG